MSSRMVRKLYCVLGILFVPILILGCKISPQKVAEKSATVYLSSNDWKSRQQGVSALIRISPETHFSQRTSDLLVQNLKDEMAKKGNFKESNDYADYIASLAFLVAQQRAKGGLPVLFQFLTNFSYQVSPVLPAYYGDAGFEYLINKVTSSSKQEQKWAVRILSLWANPPEEAEDWDASVLIPLRENQKRQVLPILLSNTKNDDADVVYLAISGLEAYVDNISVKKVLQEIAASSSREDVVREAKRILKSSKQKNL